MAILENGLTGERCLLRPHHLFGRDSARCDTVLGDPHVSRVHAHVRWTGALWELHDQSANGTMVSGMPLRNGERAVLQQGDLIHFGGTSAASWRVDELSEPADTLWPLRQPARPIRLESIHLLPGDTAQAITVFRSPFGDWLCDDTPDVRVLLDGDEVVSGRFVWRVVLAQEGQATMAMRVPDAMPMWLQQVDFTVSRDEEHVHVLLHTRGAAVDLGERVHHYCLVTLARLRCADARAGYDVSSQGWIELDALARMLGTDVSHVNVQIHRARAQFAALLSPGCEALVERRRGSVRFGLSGFRVFRGEMLECQSALAAQAATVLCPSVLAAPPTSLQAG